ncbi:FAD-dependent oxidoreductase [Sulfurospirillum multivorans]|uniref:Fumarate reductase-like flavoprotein n=2 Tax=Sulfurospirillum multivorans TaxID=66821 RepID=A0AA86E3W5_SULMK|nr:FAD-dependent oxidoreductase [Sulfurospirillum multivorans]AHJ14247.1 fumarate reductase-like flavoprotein [Sulfurospirillum multivorans DSM 12446]QEH07732.1 fumarate reductase-like flavoprotein [Sulfurospirillum multivorans]
MSIKFDAEYDVVVIGGGGSGLSAAVQVARNGNTCAVLEKGSTTGGSSSFAEGHAAFESDEQEKRGIHVSKTEAFNTYMDYSHWRADPALISRFVENAATTIVKMRDEIGAHYENVEITAPDQPGELVTWHLPEGEVARVIELLEADAIRRGVDLFMSTSATEVLRENGKIIGVKAIDADGQEVILGAKAVIVGTGGYANNPEMMDKYAKYNIGKDLINVGAEGNTGDGIKMVLEAGGIENPNIGTRLLFPLMRDKTITSHTNAAGFQPYFWVDQTGKRFVNEIVGLNFGHAGDVVASLPGAMYWSILSKESIDHLVNIGNDVGLGIYVRNYEKLVNLSNEIAADATDKDRTNVLSAGTIEELATKMKIAPSILRAEVDEYNNYCDAGEDKKFHKRAKYLHTIKEGPFYAIKMETGIMITMGALQINEYMEALNSDHEPISGLYVVGCDAGGLYGESYTLPIPGSANGFALTSGWLAADDISEKIKSGKLK